MKKFLSFLIIVGILGIFINFIWKKIIGPNNLASPIANSRLQNKAKPSPTSLPSSSSLKKAVDNVMAGSQGTYAIVIKNLLTSEAYYSNEHQSFEPGSLYKLWVMAAVFNQIQNGKLAQDEILTQNVQILNNEFDIDPEDAELTDGSITLSVKDALGQMITISHNYAALLLTEKIGLPAIDNFLQQNNLVESVVGEPPRTTAFDTALFLEKLYKGQLANEQYTKEMMDFLKAQTLNNKLPKYLPQTVAVAHKTGEIYYLSHDVGIVFTGKGDYVIAVLSEADLPAAAEEKIAQLSAAVYKYFMEEQI